ncbi:MAG: hypothetical protein K0Q55_3311 [Verrucomicrobia bacterium]|nr:hypothetical protein [Verrucomicrobiota bacterium]
MAIGAAIHRSSQRAAERTGSASLLRYGMALRILSAVFLLLMSCGLLFAEYDPKNKPEDNGMLMACGILTAVALFFFIEMFFVRIEFDETRIKTHTPWRSSREVPWSDILTFQHDQAHCWYIIKTRTHGTLRISTLLSGINDFAARLRHYATVFNYQELKGK